ncbi:hypothetical protein M5K25_009379 [Dendrobium thyrsiflorum]|uniref:Uncharacterized protein n=1 Tax=Dendrobium thyrsiflorum TaxID=117978 RepID=A0ABD0V6L9_DENTH
MKVQMTKKDRWNHLQIVGMQLMMKKVAGRFSGLGICGGGGEEAGGWLGGWWCSGDRLGGGKLGGGGKEREGRPSGGLAGVHIPNLAPPPLSPYTRTPLSSSLLPHREPTPPLYLSATQVHHHSKPPLHLPTLSHYLDKLCMGDPANDHGFLYDEQGMVDILNSPFFDVSFGNDRTADEYVDRVIYQLTLTIEDRLPQGPWYIVSNPPTSPNPTSSPATNTLRVTCLLVALLSALDTCKGKLYIALHFMNSCHGKQLRNSEIKAQ